MTSPETLATVLALISIVGFSATILAIWWRDRQGRQGE